MAKKNLIIMNLKTVAILVLLLFVCKASLGVGLPLSYSPTSSMSGSNSSLSSHWVLGWGYRDELNSSDIDYQNFWSDNAGKILTMAELTNDTIDGARVLSFLEHNGLVASNYLPEAIINSSMLKLDNGARITNRIAMLKASNTTTSDLEQLAIGDYYAGEQVLGYIGSDRILVNGAIYRSTNSTVFESSNGFVKRSEFLTSLGVFYIYLNATLSQGDAYAQVSLQVLPESSTLNSSDLLYLQVFSSSGQFDNASLYDLNGDYQRNLVYDNGSPSAQNGTIIPYSKMENVFTQDSVAIRFGVSSPQSSVVDDLEHWYQNGAFDSLSWIGVAYDAPQNTIGKLSTPIVANVYPIEHLDYRLVNDTAKYISLGVKNTTVSPPVGFGFISYGLALDSSKNPANETLASIAKNYWNYYFSRYEPFQTLTDYSTAYARSINIFALAGFTLFGCNSTIEDFARDFIGNTSGSSIEEYGWGAASLFDLKSCTGNLNDLNLYDSFVNSFGISNSSFIQILDHTRGKMDLNPQSTFQFAESATGLMLGGIPYNNSIVIRAMDAVFQSNQSGTLLNSPYRGDLANTETIPADMLSTWLFQSEMRNDTGYWITAISNANVTSIDYFENGTISLGIYGRDGSVSFMNSFQTSTISSINGYQIYDIKSMTPSATTAKVSRSTTSPSCPTGCITQPSTLVLAIAFIVILSSTLGYYFHNKRKKHF